MNLPTIEDIQEASEEYVIVNNYNDELSDKYVTFEPGEEWLIKKKKEPIFIPDRLEFWLKVMK